MSSGLRTLFKLLGYLVRASVVSGKTLLLVGLLLSSQAASSSVRFNYEVMKNQIRFRPDSKSQSRRHIHRSGKIIFSLQNHSTVWNKQTLSSLFSFSSALLTSFRCSMAVPTAWLSWSFNFICKCLISSNFSSNSLRTLLISNEVCKQMKYRKSDICKQEMLIYI